jgi:hypothetical protein
MPVRKERIEARGGAFTVLKFVEEIESTVLSDKHRSASVDDDRAGRSASADHIAPFCKK